MDKKTGIIIRQWWALLWQSTWQANTCQAKELSWNQLSKWRSDATASMWDLYCFATSYLSKASWASTLWGLKQVKVTLIFPGNKFDSKLPCSHGKHFCTLCSHHRQGSCLGSRISELETIWLYIFVQSGCTSAQPVTPKVFVAHEDHRTFMQTRSDTLKGHWECSIRILDGGRNLVGSMDGALPRFASTNLNWTVGPWL